MRRPAIIVAAVIAAILVLGFIIIVATLDVNKYRPTIQTQLSKKLNCPVTLGQLSLRLFPFSIRVTDFAIGEPAPFASSPPFAKATEVSASVGLFSVIRHNPEIKSLTLDNPQIELVRNSQDVWNFSDLGGAHQPSANSNSSSASELTLEQLKVIDGQVAVTDELKRKSRTVYNHIDAELSDFAPGQQFGLDLKMHFPGQGKQLLTVTGKGGPMQANTIAFPFTGHLSLEDVSLASLNGLSGNAIPGNTDATVTGSADLSSNNQILSCKGNMKFDNATVRGAKLAYPVELEYDLGFDLKQDTLQMRSGSAKVGPTLVSVSGNINESAQPSTVDLKLATNNASLVDVSRLASAFGVAFDPGDQVKGTISADLSAKGQLTAPHVTGTLTASTLQAQEFALSNVRANCNMSGGVVELSPVTADAYGGRVDGMITVDTKPLHPLCSVRAKLAGVDTNSLLSAATSLKNTLYGSLAADTNLNFAVDASSNLARTLNGTLDFNVTNGQLKNVNLLNELSRIGQFVGHSPAQSASGTAIKRLSGLFNITSGTAVTNNLVCTLDAASLSGNGSLNLANQGIDMHMTAVLAAGTSQSAGSSGVGGLLSTVLANKNGELVLPVLVTGTAEHPVISPDVQAIAKMKMGSLAGQNGANGILGGILGGAKGQPNQQQQNPVNSILKQFGKKKE